MMRLLRSSIALLAAAALLGGADAANAQAPADLPGRKADRMSVSFGVGYYAPLVGDDVLGLVESRLGLTREEFAMPIVRGDLTYRIAGPLDVFFRLASGATSQSTNFLQSRSGETASQVTSLSILPGISAGLRGTIGSKGGDIDGLRRFYLVGGAGGGLVRYRLHQQGEFIDEITAERFPADFSGTGGQLAGFADGFLGIHLSRSLRLQLGVEYSWMRSQLTEDFQDVGIIDLSGPAFTISLDHTLLR